MGYIEEARQAMEECLKLKEQGFTLPGSLATSYGNYGQLLGDLGHFQEALAYSDRALQIIQKMIDTGLSPFQKEKGLQLIERGELLLLLGCLDEAKVCFEKGIPLVEGTSRQVSATVARKGLQFMEQRYKENSHYYLDHQWFPRYHELASYSDVSWLTQAGPFLEEEQQEWDILIQQKEHTSASKRLSSIIVTSRKRELEASLREQREPRFHYPRVPFDEVQTRIAGFSRLRAEIERDERNAIVQRLYFGAIDELLDELHMIVSASRRNDEAFWTFNQRLNPTPTIIEMETAVGQLTSLLRNGVLRDDTRGLAKQLIQHIRQWHIDPMSSHYGSEDAEQDALAEQKKQLVTLHGSPKLFSPETVSQFFVDIFRQYQFPWTVTHDLATDHAYISQPLKQLVLPADKWISGEKIRDLLGHEIETHVFRAVAGEKSSLALLSIGLGGYLETEEGLAIYYTQEASGYNATEKPDKPWLGTLATGLAVGVICEPYTFRKLQMFLESVNTLRSLLAEENLSVAEIQENARRNAQNRCLRTWRGVTDLTRPGICSTKDNVYLRGYLAVSQVLAKDTMAFERLMVGAIGLQHLDDLTELGIAAPPVKHLRLATDPELDTYIARFAD